MKQAKMILVGMIFLLGCELRAAIWTDSFDTPQGPVTPTSSGQSIGNWAIWEQNYTTPPYTYQIHEGYLDAWTSDSGNYAANITRSGFTDGITSFSYQLAYKAVGTSYNWATYCKPTLLFSNPAYYLRGSIEGVTSGGTYHLYFEYNLPSGGGVQILDIPDAIAQTDSFLTYEFKKTDDTTWSWYYTPEGGGEQVLLGSLSNSDFSGSSMQGVQFYSKSATATNLGKHMQIDEVSVTTVPEPSVVSLVVLGAAVTYFRKRIRR